MRLLPLVLAIVLLVAGCAEKPDSKQSGDPAETSNSALPKGVINVLEGTVQALGVGPLAGVQLRLDASNQTRTSDAAGYYRFENLEPRDYLVTASYDGYKLKTQRAVVEDDKVFQLDFVLEPVPTIQPYFETSVLRGLIDCQFHYQASEDSPNRPSCSSGADPNAKPILSFNVGPGAAQIQVEMVWTPRTQFASHLTFSASEPKDGTELAYTHSASVLRVAISENVVRKYYGQGGEIRTLVQAGPSITGDEAAADFGVAFQQDYEVYLTVFYHEIGPPTFTAIPE